MTSDTTHRRTDFVSGAEAARLLDIKPQTLYAYVSRGLIRSLRQAGRRTSLYSREDIDKVLARSQARAGHGAAAAGAMRWGEPIVPTAITEITPDGPRYRGRPATELAQGGATFESVADLLWSGVWHDGPAAWHLEAAPREVKRLAASFSAEAAGGQLLEIFSLFTLTLGMTRGSPAERLRNGNPANAGRQIIQTLTGCMGYLSHHAAFTPMREGETVAAALARALDLAPTADNIRALGAILILLADHELTPSTFAARVAASSGAALHACVSAALCTNSGVEVARLYDRVEAFLQHPPKAGDMAARVREMQKSGSTPPGFNHPLYPRGDPRADYLLAMCRSRGRAARQLDALHAFLEGGAPRLNLHPRVELGVVALCLSMGLPARTAGAMFTLSRTAGWVAHVMEQRLAGFLIRPRAKFVSG